MPWVRKFGHDPMLVVDGTVAYWVSQGWKSDDAEQAQETADYALDRANNARQMVLTRDQVIAQMQATQASLSELAASYQSALAASTADRAAIHAGLDANAAADAANAAADAANLAADVADRTAIGVLQTGLATLTAGLAAIPRVSVGSASLPAQLLAGASVNLDVTLSTAMPDTTYTALISNQVAVGLLGGRDVTVAAKTTTKVTVTVKNTGLAAIAAGALSVQVIAVK